MKRIFTYLKAHPLAWVIPLIFMVLAVAIAWKLAQTPDAPFIYDP